MKFSLDEIDRIAEKVVAEMLQSDIKVYLFDGEMGAGKNRTHRFGIDYAFRIFWRADRFFIRHNGRIKQTDLGNAPSRLFFMEKRDCHATLAMTRG